MPPKNKSPLPPEFELIARYLAPLAAGVPAALGLKDDAAILSLHPDRELVATADALIAGVHFFADDPPDLIARKALRVNLSDLAAKGATPIGYLMCWALPESIDTNFIEAFTEGLRADQAEFGIAMLGGDTTATSGPLTIAITALGEVPRGRAMLRGAARPGDEIYLSGTLGDGALGLSVARGGLPGLSGSERAFLLQRYRVPQPRVQLGMALVGIARAGIDVSDGLAADLQHICETSGVGARLERSRLPLSPAAAAAVQADTGLWETVLAGGDDYELIVTAPPERGAQIKAAARAAKTPIARIGRIEPGAIVAITDEAGTPVSLARGGYRHF
jgi:thiamine-monophosphate kinase